MNKYVLVLIVTFPFQSYSDDEHKHNCSRKVEINGGACCKGNRYTEYTDSEGVKRTRCSEAGREFTVILKCSHDKYVCSSDTSCI